MLQRNSPQVKKHTVRILVKTDQYGKWQNGVEDEKDGVSNHVAVFYITFPVWNTDWEAWKLSGVQFVETTVLGRGEKKNY